MFEHAEDYVPTRQQAHAVGLLTAWETMKLLDVPIDTFADEVNVAGWKSQPASTRSLLQP